MGFDIYVLALESKKYIFIDRAYNLFPFLAPDCLGFTDDLELEDISTLMPKIAKNVFIDEGYSFKKYIKIYEKVEAYEEVSADEMEMLAYISGAIWEEYGINEQEQNRTQYMCDIIRFCNQYRNNHFMIAPSESDFKKEGYERSIYS